VFAAQRPFGVRSFITAFFRRAAALLFSDQQSFPGKTKVPLRSTEKAVINYRTPNKGLTP
jgi:hypothetical protein